MVSWMLMLLLYVADDWWSPVCWVLMLTLLICCWYAETWWCYSYAADALLINCWWYLCFGDSWRYADAIHMLLTDDMLSHWQPAETFPDLLDEEQDGDPGGEGHQLPAVRGRPPHHCAGPHLVRLDAPTHFWSARWAFEMTCHDECSSWESTTSPPPLSPYPPPGATWRCGQLHLCGGEPDQQESQPTCKARHIWWELVPDVLHHLPSFPSFEHFLQWTEDGPVGLLGLTVTSGDDFITYIPVNIEDG